MSVKKVLLQKQIESILYDIYPKTEAAIVEFTRPAVGNVGDDNYVAPFATTVAAELAKLASDIDDLPTGAEVDAKVLALRNEIFGLAQGESLDEAFDTLKEISQYLAAHGNVVSGFSADITALKTALGAPATAATGTEGQEGYVPATAATGLFATVAGIDARVTALENTAGTNVSKTKEVSGETVTAANGHLYLNGTDTTVYDDTDVRARIGMADNVAGSVSARVKALEDVGANKVEAGTTNGKLKINGVDNTITAYDDTDLKNAIGTSETTEGAGDGTGILGQIDDILDDVQANKDAIGTAKQGVTPGTGLTGRIEALEDVEATKVEDATNNGYIKVNGTDNAIQVYDDTDVKNRLGMADNVAGSVSARVKALEDAPASFQVVSSSPASPVDGVLYAVELA